MSYFSVASGWVSLHCKWSRLSEAHTSHSGGFRICLFCEGISTRNISSIVRRRMTRRCHTSPLIMNKPKSDKTLIRKPKSREPLSNVFPLLVGVEVGADDNVDESNEEYWLVDDAVMVFFNDDT